MIRKVLLVVVVLLSLLLVAAAMQPDTFRVERSATINAPRPLVFAQVNDLHEWTAWSPWEKLDPNMSKTFSGPQTGKGASYAWKGNDDVGAGKMTITKSDAPSQVVLELAFLEPFESTSTTLFDFHETDSGTHVSWTMKGNNTFMGKIFCLFMDMDSMIGKDFEKGLATLKKVSESEAAQTPKITTKPEPVAVEAETNAEAEAVPAAD